jgi:hypothetical protein
MDFQAMYENIQNQITAKVDSINEKKQEIAVIEAEIYKLQGAAEMLLVISKQLAEEQKEPVSEEQSELEPVKITNKKTNKK